jgi:TonB-linked SusC/RagA family outer membrane protein
MKRLSLILAMVVMSISFAMAQRTITGVVTDPAGEPMVGASVVVKGTTKGVVTDLDGKFSLEVPTDATTLTVSFAGFSTQDLTLGASNVLDVKLAEMQLQEVVVTAQGFVREKKALGYSVSNVSEKDIRDRPQSDVTRSLQGKIPGVNITQTSGVTGTGTNITIRGYSSITGSVQPLFVVDGVPFNSATNSRGGFTGGGQSSSSRFLDLDPNNIESISVLKGLAATVTYGDQGRNGVILVTTKNGSKKSRKTEFNVTQSYFTNEAHLPRYQNAYVGGFQQNLGYFFSNWGPTIEEAKTYPSQNTNSALTTHPYANLSNAALRAGQAEYVAGLGAYKMQSYPNNVSDFFRTGLISTTSVNMSGGGEKVGFNVSAGYTKEQGYIPNNELKRLNLGLGMNAQLTDKFTIRTSFNFANTDQISPPLNGGQGNNTLGGFPSVLANVMFTPRQVDLNGWPFEDPATGASVYFRSGNDIPNPRWILKNYNTSGIVNRIFNSTTFNYEFSKHFSMLYKVGLDTYDETQEGKFNKGGVDLVNGFYSTFNIKNTIWDNSAIMTYNMPVNEDFTFAGRLGGNVRNDRNKVFFIGSQNQLARNLFVHNNFIDNASSGGVSEETRMGIFGEFTADYKGYLFANFAGRNDWTSTVEKANRRIFYPSASFSFIPTSAFNIQSTFLNFLKLRGGIGTSAGFPNPYSTRNVLDQGARSFLNASGATVQTHGVNNFLGNPNLKPELHQETEVGVEGKILSSRVSFDLTAYRRDTRDLITTSPLDPATGYTNTTINIGKLRNEGIELMVSGSPIVSKDFSWDLTLTYSRNKPKVLDLGGTLTEVQTTGFGGALGNYAIVGKPFNMIKGSGNRRNEQGQFLIDGGGYFIATASPIILGDPNPAFLSSLSNSLNYKGLSLSAMISYRHGGAMYSSTAGALLGRGLTEDTGVETGYDRAQSYIYPGVKSDGTPNDIQITASDVGFNTTFFFTDEGRMFDGSTVRLQELALSYQLPETILKKLKLKGLSLAISGNNLWYKALNMPAGLNFDTDNLGLGVGNGLGFEFLTGPSSRRIGGTVKLTF